MIELPAPPTFASLQEFRSRIGDLEFWWPYLSEVLCRHDLLDAGRDPVAGFNATYPTFVYGDVVVKLFGYLQPSGMSHACERNAHALLASDPAIAAPAVLNEGRLYDVRDGWPYLITSRVPGLASWRAGLSVNQWQSVAAELGQQIHHLHALVPSGVATYENWATVDLTTAAGHSSLPPHLVAQVEEFAGRLPGLDRVFVHADVVANHVYVEDGRLTGIIDWGDALATDRHVELIQIYRDALSCDKSLFRIFLEASDWPVDRDFARKTMGRALHRQAIGMAQHPGIDVFQPIAEKYPLQDIATLEELADELFDV